MSIVTGVSGNKYYIHPRNAFSSEKRIVVNLTEMFGPGNEPTEEDFEKDNPEAFRMVDWSNNRERTGKR